MKLDQLSELFDQAVAITDPQARAEFVASVCPEQANRKKLQRLLAADEGTYSIMDNPEAAVRIAEDLQSDDNECPVNEGDRLRNYKLLQRIGEGGMGYVFMADQMEPIQRRVAVKIIKTPHSSRQVLARFEAERSALSRLDHPNITRIFDAGATDSGLPYFVMELVRGDSMVEYCDRHKLSIRERVELLEQVCLAAHHAHQKGVIHRDIKPANIMITMHDGQPIPKVIDFGIAKAIDRPLIDGTLFTRYGDMVGTPQYMSPEQAEKSGLDLDVRTDIYSLGAVLFELLTGSPPIEPESLNGKGVLGVLETVRDNDTESPSARATRIMSLDETVASRRGMEGQQLPRLLRGELDWITLKSLARDRGQRYESAAAMAQDLRAYLNGDTVGAAAPTFIYQARKLFQRHRTVGILVASWALMMVALTIGSSIWAVTNNRLKQLATDRANELDQQTQRLQESLTELREANERAQKAEAQALVLVNEKKEQAAMERAVMRHVLGGLKLSGLFSDPAKTSKVLNLGDIAQLSDKDKESIGQSAAAKGHLSTNQLVVSSGPLLSSTSFTVRFDELLQESQQFSGSLKSLAGLSPQQVDMMFSQPNNLTELIIEQFRHEFGDNNVYVARALVYSCRVGLLNKQLEGQIMESRLRECLAILSNVKKPAAKAVRIESEALLAKVLQQTDRTAEAANHLQIARQQFESVQTELDEQTAKNLEQELTQIQADLKQP